MRKLSHVEMKTALAVKHRLKRSSLQSRWEAISSKRSPGVEDRWSKVMLADLGKERAIVKRIAVNLEKMLATAAHHNDDFFNVICRCDSGHLI